MPAVRLTPAVRGMVVVLLATGLVACGGDEQGQDATGSAADSSVSEPLIGLTDARLDQFVAICRTADADPDRDAAQIAVARGWQQVEWMKLQARIQSISRGGGFDGMIEQIRVQLAEQGVVGVETDPITKVRVEEWSRTLQMEDQLRPGGELVEARLSELEEFLPD